MKGLLLLLLIIGLSAATGDPLLGTSSNAPSDAILEQLGFIMSILVPLMMVMIVMAAVALAIGQMFGAETRAKANTWAHGMLAAVGISALAIVMLYALVPAFMSGGTPFETDISVTIELIRGITEASLITLVGVMLVLSAVVYVIGQVSDAQTRAKASVWANGLLAGAIVASILYVIIFQILTQFETTFFGGTPLELYGRVVINIVFFVSFLILITYLVSKVFKVPEWEAYLSIELSNLMLSFLIVLFVVGLFAVGTGVSAVYGGNPSPPLAAVDYLQTVVANSVLDGLFDVYQIQACTSILSTISRRIGEFVLTQTYKVFPGLDTFVQITNVLAFGLVSVYGSLSAQIAFLYFINATMVPFFLPAGLVLRFFPPTRDAGAFLISMAFGFQIVYPTTYLINKNIFEEVFQLAPGDTLYETPTLLIASLCGPFKYGVYGVLFNTGMNPIFGAIPGGMVVGNFLARLFSESLLNFISMSEFIIIMERVSSLSLLALFMPALSMLITIAFINAMTKFIVAKV